MPKLRGGIRKDGFSPFRRGKYLLRDVIKSVGALIENPEIANDCASSDQIAAIAEGLEPFAKSVEALGYTFEHP